MNQNFELSDLDKRILRTLQADASLSNAELAERVGSSAPSCWRRVRALEEAGLLGAHVRLVHADALGLGVTILCNVRLKSYSRDVREAFDTFVKTRDEIMECFSVSGDWDYQMRVVETDVAAYEHFLMHILLEHPSVAGASSHFALSTTKYTTMLPVR
jgi:DNA-binding Lrp family transcriptional regulator